MGMIDTSLEKIKHHCFIYRKEFDYGVLKKEGETEYQFLKKYCLYISKNFNYLTEREILSIIAEIYFRKDLTSKQKNYLYNKFLKRPEKENNFMFWRLTEREKEVEKRKELHLQIMQLKY
jgi:hypothetical protein